MTSLNLYPFCNHDIKIQFNFMKNLINHLKTRILNRICENYFNFLLSTKINKDYSKNNYKFFKTKDDIPNSFKQNLNLNHKMEETVRYYSGYGSMCINDYLRHNEKFLHEKYVKNQIQNLKALIKTFSTSNNIIVIRHLQTKFCQNYEMGKIYQEKGFLSTSLYLSYRTSYHGGNIKLKNNSLMIIKIPKRTNYLPIESIRQHGDYEIILKNDTKLLIEDIKNCFWNNTKFIFAKIIN